MKIGKDVVKIEKGEYVNNGLHDQYWVYGVFENCRNLEEVTFADGCMLTEIPARAFSGCSKLRSISFPASLTTIGESAFEGCGLTSLTLPAGIKEIQNYAFSGCGSLNIELTLKAGVTL